MNSKNRCKGDEIKPNDKPEKVEGPEYIDGMKKPQTDSRNCCTSTAGRGALNTSTVEGATSNGRQGMSPRPKVGDPGRTELIRKYFLMN